MPKTVTVGLAQMASSASKDENLRKILKFIRDARGVDLLVFPEYAMGFSGEMRKEYFLSIAEELDGPFLTEIRKAVKSAGINAIVTLFEKCGEDKVYNTAVFIDRVGDVAGIYRKVHLFDAFGYRESDIFEAGDEAVVVDADVGKVGIAICFDIRFPEFIRTLVLQGAEIIAVPAAWFRGPFKEEQWFMLLRTRAHENTVFVVAVDNAGDQFCARSTVVHPLGYTLLDAGVGEKLMRIRINLGEIDAVRKQLPLLTLRRPDVYRLEPSEEQSLTG